MLRVNDVNSDGFPDLLVTLYNKTEGDSSARSYLYMNEGCGDSICKESSHKRYLTMADGSYNDDISSKNSHFASFMDFGEMGFKNIKFLSLIININEKLSFVFFF